MSQTDYQENPQEGASPALKGEEVQRLLAQRRERLALDRRRRLALVTGALFLFLAVTLWLVLRSHKGSGPEEEEAAPVVSVQVAKVEKEAIATQISAIGTIVPREQATVSAKISAQIRKMALLKDKVVRAGEVLAVLESRDLVAQRNEAVAALREAQASERSTITGNIPQANAQDEKAVRDARANVGNARATYERRQTVYAQGGISKKELEASELALTQAEDELRLAEQTRELRTRSLNPNDRALAAARVAQAQQHLATLDAQLSYATIRAPITGIVTDQFQYEGEFAAAGAKLLNIADISQVIVKAPFADTVATQVKVGDNATVSPTDESGDQISGQISLVSRATDPTNRTVELWVTLANAAGRLRANGAAQVTISTKAKSDATVVPASAVTLETTNGFEGSVMVVDANSLAREKKVEVGIRSKDKLEIVSGLQPGETVVIEGNYALPDGTKVEVKEKKKADSDAAPGEKKEEP